MSTSVDFEKRQGFKYKNITLVTFIITICFILYLLLSNETDNKYNFANIIIFSFSLFICLWCINDIKKNTLQAHNIFLLVFNACLLWNTFNISGLQLKKELTDVYFFFAGPLIFSIFLFLGERLKVNKIKISKELLNNRINIVIIIILMIYVMVNFYIYKQVGFRLSSDKLIKFTGGEEYVVPIFSGLAYTLMWTMLIFLPHVKKQLMALIIFCTIMFSGVLHAKRGNILRIVLLLFVYYCYRNRKKFFKQKNIIIIVLLLLLFAFAFGYSGELRQFDDNEIFDIKALIQSNYDSYILNWIYAYTAMNFETLKAAFIVSVPSYFPYEILLPIMRFWSGVEIVSDHTEASSAIYVGITNSSTFLSGFIADYGSLYIIEITIFGFFICFLLLLTKKIEFEGLYIFILTWLIFLFFGNYFKVNAMFLGIFFSLLIYICCISNFKAPSQRRQMNIILPKNWTGE